ncbi:hypothetical protein [Lactobacillus intestinalis]|nr:hypothetical protein [Lactobacillus intestinalis]
MRAANPRIYSRVVDLLKEFKPAMLLIEHDPYFIKEVADQVIEL